MIAEALAALPGADLLRTHVLAYIVVSAAHILGIALLVVGILPLDVRLLWPAPAPERAADARRVPRTAAFGLGWTVLTGLYLLSVRPADYLANPAFQAKMLLLAAALVVIVLQHAGAGWKRVLVGGAPGRGVRLLALASLILWLATLLAGRWIGFA